MQFCCIQNTRYETNLYHLYKLRLRVYIAGKYLIGRIYANQPRALQREKLLLSMKDIGVTFEQRRSVDRIY